MDMLPVRILAPASKPDIPISSVAVLECYLETGLSWNLHFGSQALASIHPVASAANSSTFYGCLNVFGMALDYFILVLLLDIWPQNSYADFCFIKCGLNIVMRH